jgi:hypothetical protein
MVKKLSAKDVVNKIPKTVFWDQIQKNLLTSYEFSKLRCGGEKDLTPEEKAFLDSAFEKYLPEYDVKKEGRLSLARALTAREVNRY